MKDKFGPLILKDQLGQIEGIITKENSPYNVMQNGWNKIKDVLTHNSSNEFDIIHGLTLMEQETSSLQTDAALARAQDIKNIHKNTSFGVHDQSAVVYIKLMPLNSGGAVLLCQQILDILLRDNHSNPSDDSKAASEQEDRSNYMQEELQNAINNYSSSSPLAPLSVPTIEMSINPSEADRENIIRILGDKLQLAENEDSEEKSNIPLTRQELEELDPIVRSVFQKALHQELKKAVEVYKQELEALEVQDPELEALEVHKQELQLKEQAFKQELALYDSELAIRELKLEDNVFMMCLQKPCEVQNKNGDIPYHSLVRSVPLARIPGYMELLPDFNPFVQNNAGETPYDILTKRNCELYNSKEELSKLDESSREKLGILLETWGKQKIAAEEGNSEQEVVAEHEEGVLLTSEELDSLDSQEANQLMQSFVVLGDQTELSVVGQTDTETDMDAID